MKHPDEARTVAFEAGIPTLLQTLKDFCDLNSEHITCDTAVGVDLRGGWLPSIHLDDNGNAPKAVSFALDIVDSPRVYLIRHKEARHVYVCGEFERLPIEVLSCSTEYDSSVIDSYVDWEQRDRLGNLEISPDLLLKMAEHTS